jgi:hypothetical protein
VIDRWVGPSHGFLCVVGFCAGPVGNIYSGHLPPHQNHNIRSRVVTQLARMSLQNKLSLKDLSLKDKKVFIRVGKL